MLKRAVLITTLSAGALLAFPVRAQEGPYVPCADCEHPQYLPYPETGSWYNPDQSGSGITVEIQNGTVLAYYFGYNAAGAPEWLLLVGELVRSETPGVMWEVALTPKRLTGGNCLGCEYKPPDTIEPQAPIRIEFLQRAYARMTLGDDSQQYLVPVMYGDAGRAYFAEQTPYLFPELKANPYASMWTMVIKKYSESDGAPWTWVSGIVLIEPADYPKRGDNAGKLIYRVYVPTTPPEVTVRFGTIVCGADVVGPEVACQLKIYYEEPVYITISIGNFTDDRIFGESDDGYRMEAFRLKYD